MFAQIEFSIKTKSIARLYLIKVLLVSWTFNRLKFTECDVYVLNAGKRKKCILSKDFKE